MRRETKSQRRLGLKKETVRTLSADELLLAAGGDGTLLGPGAGTLANSLSGSRKCATSGNCELLP